MKKIHTLLTIVFLTYTVSAEEIKYLTDFDFIKSISEVKKILNETKNEKIEIKFEKVKGNYIQLSGYLTLNGSAWIPQNGGFVSTTLSGWVQLKDNSGNYHSDNEYVQVYISFWANPNQYIFQTVYPNVYIRVYDKTGKFVGSTTTTGSINVSGWASNNFVNLYGNGYISASIYVQEN